MCDVVGDDYWTILGAIIVACLMGRGTVVSTDETWGVFCLASLFSCFVFPNSLRPGGRVCLGLEIRLFTFLALRMYFHITPVPPPSPPAPSRINNLYHPYMALSQMMYGDVSDGKTL